MLFRSPGTPGLWKAKARDSLFLSSTASVRSLRERDIEREREREAGNRGVPEGYFVNYSATVFAIWTGGKRGSV